LGLEIIIIEKVVKNAGKLTMKNTINTNWKEMLGNEKIDFLRGIFGILWFTTAEILSKNITGHYL
jgi:hypothetical protein